MPLGGFGQNTGVQTKEATKPVANNEKSTKTEESVKTEEPKETEKPAETEEKE